MLHERGGERLGRLGGEPEPAQVLRLGGAIGMIEIQEIARNFRILDHPDRVSRLVRQGAIRVSPAGSTVASAPGGWENSIT